MPYMKLSSTPLSLAFALTATVALTGLTSFAQGKHPAYLHALTDLRAARAHLEKCIKITPTGAHPESKAIQEIDGAIAEIKQAGIDDGKDLNDHPAIDTKLDKPGLRHQAIKLLQQAHADVNSEEDNKFAQGLQQRAFGHIDRAEKLVQDALREM
jgi:tetratricopeptide (TPR) repeat protein